MDEMDKAVRTFTSLTHDCAEDSQFDMLTGRTMPRGQVCVADCRKSVSLHLAV